MCFKALIWVKRVLAWNFELLFWLEFRFVNYRLWLKIKV